MRGCVREVETNTVPSLGYSWAVIIIAIFTHSCGAAQHAALVALADATVTFQSKANGQTTTRTAKGVANPYVSGPANTKRCGPVAVTGGAVRVHNAQMYVAADVCGTVPSPSLAVCVQVAHVYAPADVCGAKTGRNIGVCVRIDNMYAASEVCCKEEGPNLGACVHAGTMCASTEVWECPPTSEGVKLHGDVVARSVRETQTDCAQSGEGIPRSSARVCVGMCATGPPALWVVLS